MPTNDWVRKMLEKANSKEPEAKPNTGNEADPKQVEKLVDDLKRRLQQGRR